MPDFLVNRMGIVQCADEVMGYINSDPLIEKHLNKTYEHSIRNSTFKLMEDYKTTNKGSG